MQSLVLSPELTEVLAVEAARVGKTLSDLAEEWLRQQYQNLRRTQLAEQTEQFWAKHSELYVEYPDKFVAYYDGTVLDHDDDISQLAIRIRSEHGALPVVIAQVTAEPLTEYKMRSPRLQTQTL